MKAKVQLLPLPTVRLALLFVVAAIVVALLPRAPWPALGSALALLLISVIDWLRAGSPSAVVVTRDMPPSASLRQTPTIQWSVSSSVRRTQTLWFADELPPSFRAQSRRFKIRLTVGGTAQVETVFAPSRRGSFTVSEIVVRVQGPWGLIARQGQRQSPSVIKIFPPFESRRLAELMIERAKVSEVGLRSVRGRGGGTEFDQLREYSVDDDTRRIDWAATVRTGKPIVRTYRAEQNQNVVLMLDTGRVMAGQVNGVPRLEYAMDAMMALSTVVTRLGDRAGMVGFADDIRTEVPARHGNSQVSRITEAMFALEPELVESNYRLAFTHTLARFRRRSLVVLFTELSSHAVSEVLLPAMPIITKRHVLLIAGVTDPDVASWARSVPEEASKAFRKAAAIDALAQRQQTVSALRARGAMVVDGEPSKLAASVINAYLTTKATSRL